MPLCLGLFWRFPFSSMLHNGVLAIVLAVFQSKSDALLTQLLGAPCQLLQHLLAEYELHDLDRDGYMHHPPLEPGIGLREAARRRKGVLRPGYMGHLAQIAAALETSLSEDEIEKFLEAGGATDTTAPQTQAPVLGLPPPTATGFAAAVGPGGAGGAEAKAEMPALEAAPPIGDTEVTAAPVLAAAHALAPAPPVELDERHPPPQPDRAVSAAGECGGSLGKWASADIEALIDGWRELQAGAVRAFHPSPAFATTLFCLWHQKDRPL